MGRAKQQEPQPEREDNPHYRVTKVAKSYSATPELVRKLAGVAPTASHIDQGQLDQVLGSLPTH